MVYCMWWNECVASGQRNLDKVMKHWRTTALYGTNPLYLARGRYSSQSQNIGTTLHVVTIVRCN